jgi:hypothetical protein
MTTEQINGGEYRRPKGQSKKDNPEELTTMVTGQINGGEFRRGNQWPLLSVTLDYPFLIAPSVFGILHRLFVL